MLYLTHLQGSAHPKILNILRCSSKHKLTYPAGRNMVRASSVHRATILRGPPGHTGNLQLDISDCASTLGGRVYYNLINVTTNDSVREGSSCWSQMVSSLPAGSYRLVISNGGHTGTYELDASLQP